MVQKVVVDCTTGEQQMVDMTPEELAAYEAQSMQVAAEDRRQQIAAHEQEFSRQQAILNLLSSSAVASDPALGRALSYILGV
jgi:hypothetical protein